MTGHESRQSSETLRLKYGKVGLAMGRGGESFFIDEFMEVQ